MNFFQNSLCESILDNLSANSPNSVVPINNLPIPTNIDNQPDIDSIISYLVSFKSKIGIEKSGMRLKISELENQVTILNSKINALELLNNSIFQQNKILAEHNNSEVENTLFGKSDIASNNLIVDFKNKSNFQINEIPSVQNFKLATDKFSHFEINEILENLDTFQAKTFTKNYVLSNSNSDKIYKTEQDLFALPEKVPAHLDAIRSFVLIEDLYHRTVFTISDDCSLSCFELEKLDPIFKMDRKNSKISKNESEYSEKLSNDLSDPSNYFNKYNERNLFAQKQEKTKWQNKCRLRTHLGPIFSLDYSKHQNCLASGGSEGIIRFWDVSSFSDFQNSSNPIKFVHQTKITSDVIWSLQFNRCFSSLLSCVSSDGICRIFENKNSTKKCSQKMEVPGDFSLSKFSELNSKELLLASFNNPSLMAVDLFSQSIFLKRDFPTCALITCIDFDMDHNSLLCGTDQGMVFNDDFRVSSSQTALFKTDYAINFVKFYGDNKLLVGGGCPFLQIFDIRKAGILAEIEIGVKKFDENLLAVQIGSISRDVLVSAADGSFYSLAKIN